MNAKKLKWGWGFAVAALAMASPPTSFAGELNPNNPLNPPAPLYWCPNRPADQHLATTPEPGCAPLVKEEEELKTRGSQRETTPPEPIKIQNIQNAASSFVRRYSRFLDCCATDIGSLNKIEDLEQEASNILKSIQQSGVLNAAASSGIGTIGRQWTLNEIIPPVLQARDDLRKLKQRLELVGESKEKLNTLDSEAAGRERLKIQQMEESIKREFRPIRPPDSARTGMEIEDTTLPYRFGNTLGNTTGGDSTLPNAFGPDIGDVTSPNSDQREDLRFRRGTEIQDTTLPNRIGPATQDTNLPYSFGFELEHKQNPTGSTTTPNRVGPNIGDSSLNRPPLPGAGSGSPEDPSIRNPGPGQSSLTR